MGKKTKLIFFIFGFGFFCYLVQDFGIRNIIINIRKTSWWILPVIGVWGIGYILNTLTWEFILGEEAKKFGFGELYGISLSSFAINYITPFINLGGEPYRILSVQKVTGSHRAISSVILFRMVHSLGHFFFCLIAILVVVLFVPFPGNVKLALLAAFLILLVLIVFFFSAHKKGIFKGFLRLISKISSLKSLTSKLKKWEVTLLEIDVHIREFYNHRRPFFYLALGSEVLSRFIQSFEFFFILNSIGFKISILHAFYISAASTIILNILFFIPFEMGTREGSLYLLMGTMHFPPGIGVFVSLVNRIREFFWILVGLGLIQITGRHFVRQDISKFAEDNPYDKSHPL